MIYLYIKTSPLGLNYLGKTIKNPNDYVGSGTIWKRHLKKYNFKSSDIITKIIYSTENKNDFKYYAIKISIKLDVVNSKLFANLTNEEGQGGNTWNNISEEGKQRFLNSDKSKSELHKKKISNSLIGHINHFKIPVYQFSIDGILIQKFESLADACKSLGKKPNNSSEISNHIKGGRIKKRNGKTYFIKSNSAFGFKWSYNNELKNLE